MGTVTAYKSLDDNILKKGDNMKTTLSFETVYGSVNYRLNRADSDEDMMYFYNPTYEQLYSGKMAGNIKDPSTDRKHHDVRKIPQLFFKANVNFLEILFARKVKTYDNLYGLLVPYREDIASMNIPYLFDGCMGMFRRNYLNLLRDAHYVDKEDVMDPESHARKLGKHAGSAYRILDFVQRYARLGFKDFQRAISYDPDIPEDQKVRDLYMAMRDGCFRYAELDDILKKKEEEARKLESYYKEQKVKEEVNQFVVATVKNHVKEMLIRELFFG